MDNKMDLGETRWDVANWIDVAENRGQCWAFVKEVMNLRIL
jgi:hypothetical protein